MEHLTCRFIPLFAKAIFLRPSDEVTLCLEPLSAICWHSPLQWTLRLVLHLRCPLNAPGTPCAACMWPRASIGSSLESVTAVPGCACGKLVSAHKWPLERLPRFALASAIREEAQWVLTCSGSGPCRYLEEVGYTDTILDMRSKRVRSLLGRSLELNGATEPSDAGPRVAPGPGGLSGGESLLVKQIEEQIKR